MAYKYEILSKSWKLYFSTFKLASISFEPIKVVFLKQLNLIYLLKKVQWGFKDAREWFHVSDQIVVFRVKMTYSTNVFVIQIIIFFFTCGPSWTQACSHVICYIPGPFGLLFAIAPTHILEWHHVFSTLRVVSNIQR